jgi:nitroreductase/Pyruvate/2-oxoacid:ferredoxin oxidoreductase delta subunit
MLDFTVNSSVCTRCGQCAVDCPPRIIAMNGGYPAIAEDKETLCYRCQHCLAVCPTGAISIFGIRPGDVTPLEGNYPRPKQLETLIEGRRSVRRYREENLDPELIKHLLEVAWHAPTGVNARQVHFTVVDDREKMLVLRSEVMAGLGRLVREGKLPEGFERFADFARLWEEKGIDTIFRGAPHLLVASVPHSVPTPLPDCLIALSYFELFAQCHGVGTVWCGLGKWALNDLLPEVRARLGIPEDHLFGYAMMFGKPAVGYARTVRHQPAFIHRFEG